MKKLHEKILKELSQYNYNGIIVYSGFNELLINKACFDNIARTRKYLPTAKIELITNGDVLNLIKLKKLFISGLSTILISVYDGPEDMIKFKRLCEQAKLDKNQYVIRNRYLPPEDDYGITMSNRGGQMKNAVHSISSLKKSIKQPCYYPSYNLFIDYNGDVGTFHISKMMLSVHLPTPVAALQSRRQSRRVLAETHKKMIVKVQMQFDIACTFRNMLCM